VYIDGQKGVSRAEKEDGIGSSLEGREATDRMMRGPARTTGITRAGESPRARSPHAIRVVAFVVALAGLRHNVFCSGQP